MVPRLACGSFFIKCSRCSSEIAFKTDPKNADYTMVPALLRLPRAVYPIAEVIGCVVGAHLILPLPASHSLVRPIRLSGPACSMGTG